MDIKAYIESGVIESYVLGMAESQEAAELEQLSRQYPEIKQAIDEFETALEQQSMAAAMPPPAQVKEAFILLHCRVSLKKINRKRELLLLTGAVLRLPLL